MKRLYKRMGKIVLEPELATAFLEGDSGAVGEVYRRSFRLLYLLAAGILKSPDDAFDAVHDVFLKVLSGGLSIQRKEHLLPYLATSVRNRALSILSKRREKTMLAEAESVPSFDSGNPYFAAICPDLEPNETAVLVLHLAFELSFRDIAEITSVPRSTLYDLYRSGLSKARRSRKEARHE